MLPRVFRPVARKRTKTPKHVFLVACNLSFGADVPTRVNKQDRNQRAGEHSYDVHVHYVELRGKAAKVYPMNSVQTPVDNHEMGV